MRNTPFAIPLIFIFFSFVGYAQIDLTWAGNDHFVLKEDETTLKVEMKKLDWESFSLVISETDLSKQPHISFKIKSDQNIDLRIDVLDHNNANLTQQPVIKKVPSGNDFMELQYYFGQMNNIIDLKRIHHFQFFVNPGKKHSGTIVIKDFNIGNALEIENESSRSPVSFFPNPVVDQLQITSENTSFDELIIIDELRKVVFSKTIPTTKQATIHVKHLPLGIYFLELKQNNQPIYSGSFVRQH